MTQSVSFRITRTAEDVAQTLNALSQRLVKLEQRLESLDLQLRQQQEARTMAGEEIDRLDGVDLILQECQDLLRQSDPAALDQAADHEDHEVHGHHEGYGDDSDQSMAA